MSEEFIKGKLLELTKNSKSLYYRYPVAAIIECKDGKLYAGVNVETSSPAAGICAERNALYSAITSGYKKGDFKRLHLLAASGEVVYPCFICRQALYDYCDHNMPITIYDADEDKVVYSSLTELCIHGFSDDDLV